MSTPAPSEPPALPQTAPPHPIKSPLNLLTPAILESTAPQLPAVRHRILQALTPRLNGAPPFKTYLRRDGPDILIQILVFVGATCIYEFAPPLLPRYFPYYPGIETTSWGLKHSKPFVKEYINTFQSAVISFAIPAAVIGAIGLWGTRSFEHVNAALLALATCLTLSTLSTCILKLFIGGLRPHFLTICAPEVPQNFLNPGIQGEVLSFTPSQICTAPPRLLKEAQMSFPSGHANAAFAGFGLLALYLNSCFKVFGGRRFRDVRRDVKSPTTVLPTAAQNTVLLNISAQQAPLPGLLAAPPTHRAMCWKLVVFVLPWLFAAVLALSKVRDMWHHPVDVAFGAVTGTVFAIMAYRMRFRSVWDARDNHLPLSRGQIGQGDEAGEIEA